MWAKPAAPPLLRSRPEGGEIVTLSEAEAKDELAAAGVIVPGGRSAATVEEATAAAESLGFPVVLKGLGVAHKTEAGAVRLNLTNRDEVIEAARGMASVASGYLVER